MELKRRVAMNEESIEIDIEIWSKLPEKPLMVVLSCLPTFINRDLRLVCKRWQYLLSPAPMFRQISSTLVPSSSPAFFIGNKREKYFPHTLSHSLFLLHSEPLGVYPLSLDFMGSEIGGVLTACKNILCCLSRYVKREPCSYYICNPLTTTWIKLPPLPYPIPRISEFKFHGLAFSSATRSCILVIGCNFPINGEKNNMVMEIYDSDTNEWTLINMNLRISIFPWQEGLYSTGRFYWANVTVGEDTDILAFDIAVYNIVEKNWEIIKLPRRSDCLFYWNLTGYDGNVIVVDNSDLSLWKLNEEHESGERYNWLEL
ncbi:hypothetical protein SUGI_1096560 [Cryptomeria japonica]|nr:hypothetical protein SUGI_1096560 [Cryptomeria japonica]